MATVEEVKPSENGINGDATPPEEIQEVESDDEVRRHTSTSVSRIKQNSLLAAGEAIKMEDIKQKIDFTTEPPDNNEHPDPNCDVSLSPTLSKSEEDEQPSKLKSSASPSLNNSIVDDEGEYDNEEEGVEISEDMFATASTNVNEEKTTVETIMERLNAVRTYTEDARNVYEQLQLHEHEPGNLEQMERVSMLISQLKQQELSYLQVLLKLMENHSVDDEELNKLEMIVNRSRDDEYNSVDEEEEDDDIEGEGSNDSMSLKAELSKSINTTQYNGEQDGDDNEFTVEELAEQREELQALHEQRALLLKLQEQQTQLKVLQMKQAKLLQLKKDAEERLSEAEKQFDELGEDSRDQSLLTEEDNRPVLSDRENILMDELEELKRKRIRAEKLMATTSPQAVTDTSPPTNLTTDHIMNDSKDELVDSGLQELQSRMKQVEDARNKMKELQQMVEMLQVMSVGNQSTEDEVLVAKPQQQKGSGSKERLSPPTQNDTNETQDEEVIHLLADYERDIGKRQRELEDIRKKKEELKRVEGMLKDLKLMSEGHTAPPKDHPSEEEEVDSLIAEEEEDQGLVSQGLANELSKQQELYTDLKRKTQQLKQLQQEIEKLSRGSDLDSAVADTTIATWGGSSVDSIQSTGPEEDTGRDRRRSNDPNLPQYQVDRHTPRHPRPLRRAYSPHDEQDSTIGKKIKLEPPSGGSATTPTSKKTGGNTQSTVTPSVNKRSAVWPSVIFSQSASKTNAGKVQTPPSFSCPKGATPALSVPNTTVPEVGVANDYTSLLQQQLGNSSAMCFQLMEQQSSLIQALNQKLDTLPHIHEQMIQLHEYHDHLQGYHEYLNNAYWQILEYSNNEAGPNEVGGTKQGAQESDAGEDKEEAELSINPTPSKTKPSLSFLEDPFSGTLYPPPQLPSTIQPSINSPYPRPVNPHLQASPSTKLPRPFSRPPSYPYSLYGASTLGSVAEATPGKQNQETQYEVAVANGNSKDTVTNSLEVESSSSLPDRGLPHTITDGVTVFDKLRDTIYSEVATLIASNEDRPHFLVELFRELQLLNTDYLRQRALYSIQDLVTRFLKLESTLDQDESINDGDADPLTEGIPVLTVARRGNSQRFDYTENAESASSISTPPISDEQPFASDILGETVVKMTKVEPSNEFELDTSELDEEVKSIMTNVIPLLKSHLSELCNDEILSMVKSAVIDQVTSNASLKVEGDLGSIFVEQLHTSLSTVIEKYHGKVLKECGEDLLVDISEVLFNEVAFYRLLKETQGMSGKDYYNSMTSNSQTTTDMDSITNSPQQRPVVSSLSLQALGTMISKTLQDESESLGNRRDDDFAQAWEPDTDIPNIPEPKESKKPTEDVKNDVQQVEVEEDMIENGYVNVITTTSTVSDETTPTTAAEIPTLPKEQDEVVSTNTDKTT